MQFHYIIKIMTINGQIRDKKLQYDIDRKAAEISTKSSGKLHKYEYLTASPVYLIEYISIYQYINTNIQNIPIYLIEEAKFPYSPLGKTFEKQTKTIEDQGKKQIDALKNLKLKLIEEETKPIEDKPNNQSRAAIIFSDLINKSKELMKELRDNVDYNYLKFEYVDKKMMM